MLAKSSNVSLIVGFPAAQPSSELGALHRKFKLKQDEKVGLINGYTVDVPANKLDSYIAALPQSATVMVDEPLFRKPSPSEARARQSSDRVIDAENDEPATPYLSRPAGLAELHAQGIQGQGTTIAVVDSGIANHADFKSRIKHFQDFSASPSKTPIDNVGHGTHVAGIAAGDGDLVDGIAPKAELVSLKIGSPLEAIKAIGWAIAHKEEYDIDILNISLGITDRLPSRQDPFAQAAQQAIEAGIITIVAAGNEGNDCSAGMCRGTISSPGILPDAITVGAYDDSGTLALNDDKIWFKTSLGPTASDKTHKPDLVAPGVGVLAPKSTGSHLGKTRPNWEAYLFDDGSSMATPMVSGAAALLLQVNPNLKQADIKSLLMETASPLSDTPKDAQGAGRLNLTKAISKAQAKA